MRIASAVLLMFGLTALASGAQNLGDMARQLRESRSEVPASERTITTEAAIASRPGARVSVPGAQAVPPAAPSEAIDSTGDAGDDTAEPAEDADTVPTETGTDASDQSTPTDTEEAWRGRFDEVRTEIQRAERRLELAQLELEELNRQLLTRSDIYNREYQLAPMIAAKQEEIADTRQRLNRATQDLDTLRTELRRAGLPAGWGR